MALYSKKKKRKPEDRDYLTQATGRIEMTRRWRRQEDIDDSWKRFIDLYRHKQFEERAPAGLDRVVVNYIFSTINVMFPSVSVSHPKVTVAARKPEDDMASDVAEAVINYWWKHLKFQKQFRRAAKDYLIIGHGWLKTTWKYDEKTVPRDPAAIADDHQQAMQEQQGFAMQNPDMASELPSSQDVLNSIPIHELQVQADEPCVSRISPFDMFIDPVAVEVDEARWIAQRIWMTEDEVHNCEQFDPTVRAAVEAIGDGPSPHASIEDDDDMDDMRRKDSAAKYVCVWEYYDIANDIMFKFAEGAEKNQYLVKPKQIPYPFGHPYVMIANYEVPEHIYPLGDVEALESLQHELNLTRTQMVNDRKQNVQKYVMWKDDIDKEVRSGLQSPVHNEIIGMDRNTSVDLEKVIVPIRVNPVAPDFYQQSAIIEQDLNLVSGVSEYQRGGTPDTRQTATEAGIRADSANARASDKLADIEAAVTEVAARLIILAQMYLTTEQVARIVGPDGQQMWVHFDAEAIAGEFDFDVEGGSTQPNNESFRRQSALQMSTALAPYAARGFVNEKELARYLLEKGFGVKNADRFVQDPPPPMHQPPPPTIQDKFIETINYKDAPPDVQREMEAQAGLKPSTIGGSSPMEQGVLGMTPPPPPHPTAFQPPQPDQMAPQSGPGAALPPSEGAPQGGPPPGGPPPGP